MLPLSTFFRPKILSTPKERHKVNWEGMDVLLILDTWAVHPRILDCVALEESQFQCLHIRYCTCSLKYFGAGLMINFEWSHMQCPMLLKSLAHYRYVDIVRPSPIFSCYVLAPGFLSLTWAQAIVKHDKVMFLAKL